MSAGNESSTGRTFAASTMVGSTKVNWDDSKMRSTSTRTSAMSRRRARR